MGYVGKWVRGGLAETQTEKGGPLTDTQEKHPPPPPRRLACRCGAVRCIIKTKTPSSPWPYGTAVTLTSPKSLRRRLMHASQARLSSSDLSLHKLH